jgi:hypothetical protein
VMNIIGIRSLMLVLECRFTAGNQTRFRAIANACL